MTLLSHTKKSVQSVAAEAFEKHYTILQLVELWSLSERTIRRMFEGEEGVMSWENDENKRKRSYETLPIPESVMLRVYERHRKAG
jgi:hypothetical protein